MVISFIGNTAAVPVAIDGTVAASRASAEWIDPGLTPDQHPTAFFEASDADVVSSRKFIPMVTWRCSPGRCGRSDT